MTAQGPQAGAFHLALASDANPGYPAGLTVAAASALRHLSPQASLTVHVLDLGIPDADFAQIEAILRKVRADVSVRRHPIDPARFKDLPHWKGSLAAYARLSLPDLLPEVDWVCYADCDVLFTGDLTDLFALADSTFWMLGHSHDLPALPSVAAAQHRWHEAHGLPYDKTHYVCSGLLLMNLRAFREQDLTTRCLDFCRTYLDSRTPDQDALNTVCREHMGILPDFWGTIDPQCAPRALQGAFPFMGMVPWCATRDRFCWYAGVYVRELARLWRLTADKIIPKDSPWRDAMPLLRGLWWQRWLSPLLWLRLPRWMAAPPWVRGRRARLKRLWFRRGEPIPESDFWIE